MKYRMSFSKDESLKFISHLDLRRAFTRAVRRSRLPVVYTQGFNPHPDLVFSPPLSVGYVSRCELLELALTEDMGFEEVKSSMNRALPPGIRIISVWEPVKKISEIMYSSYEITFKSSAGAEIINSALNGSSLSVNKKTKTSEYRLELSGHMHRLELTSDKNSVLTLNVILPSGNDLTVNPRLIFEALELSHNIQAEIIKIERTGIFDCDFNQFQ